MLLSSLGQCQLSGSGPMMHDISKPFHSALTQAENGSLQSASGCKSAEKTAFAAIRGALKGSRMTQAESEGIQDVATPHKSAPTDVTDSSARKS